MAISLKPVGEQVIVITGASSGIGLATAEMAAEEGAKLILAAPSEDALEGFAARLSRNGAEALAVDADVGDRAEVEQIALAAIERFGRIDTWVNNAGVTIPGRLDQASDADCRRLFETNFWGVVYGSLVALHHMRAAGGAIINLGSDISDAAIPLQGMYAASKQAVKGFTDALRAEVEDLDGAPVGITLLPIETTDPSQVAAAILEAAAHHAREGKPKPNGISKIDTAVAKVLPKVDEKLTAKVANKNGR
ncbi:MAG TPA: SDR family NAD(P)-dependent oxidoreductase [Polyangia bacterium]|nr:SDR family NAD(P)-dependent oxidoreductase [Polyangia bacterium]